MEVYTVYVRTPRVTQLNRHFATLLHPMRGWCVALVINHGNIPETKTQSTMQDLCNVFGM